MAHRQPRCTFTVRYRWVRVGPHRYELRRTIT